MVENTISPQAHSVLNEKICNEKGHISVEIDDIRFLKAKIDVLQNSINHRRDVVSALMDLLEKNGLKYIPPED